MLQTIKGVYENGVIILDEKPNISKANVYVTIIEEILESPKKERTFGALKGKMKIADDFEAPLDELKEYM